MKRYTFLILFFAFSAVQGQDTRRLHFGLGAEYAAKAQILPEQGSKYGVTGEFALYGSLRISPAYGERGFTSTIHIGYVRDDSRYVLNNALAFGVDRECARIQMETMFPTRREMLWWTAAIGVDWNTNILTSLHPSSAGGASSFYADADLYRADLDLFAARRLLLPYISFGPALRITANEKPLWAQLFVRQAFLDAYQEPVVVTMRTLLSAPQQIVVSQRPTYIGIMASYFF